MKAWTLLLAVFFLAGCATTKGKDTKIENYFYIYNNKDTKVEISPLVDQQSATGDIRDLTATNDTAVPVDISIPVTKTNPAEIIKGAAAATVIDEVLDAVEPVVKPTTQGELLEEVSLKVYMDCSSGECQPTNKIWGWTSKQCNEYGGSIVVTIPGCGSFIVEDPCELYTPSGNPNDFSSWVWFPGLASKQKDTHPLGYASVFSKPGCTQPVTATITRK